VCCLIRLKKIGTGLSASYPELCRRLTNHEDPPFAEVVYHRWRAIGIRSLVLEGLYTIIPGNTTITSASHLSNSSERHPL
jgi:hypothetical protein